MAGRGLASAVIVQKRLRKAARCSESTVSFLRLLLKAGRCSARATSLPQGLVKGCRSSAQLEARTGSGCEVKVPQWLIKAGRSLDA